jgi:hypothetical protein
MVSSKANVYNMNSLSKSGMTRTRAIVMACLISVKAF